MRKMEACTRILAEVRRTGAITNKRACEVTGLRQAHYLLAALRKQGLLQREGGWRLKSPHGYDIKEAALGDLNRLIDELRTLSNLINQHPARAESANLHWVQQEIDMLIYSFDPDPPLNVRE